MNSQDFRALQEAYNQVYELEEGMMMKDFKQQRSRQKQKDKREALKTSPTRRAGIHADKASPERAARHRANVDPDFEGNDERNYPGGKLRPNKVRKAKALGELGEQVDLYDIILSHLLDEGYAESVEQAEVIMVNMSEDWRESICEAAKDQSDKQIEKGVKTTYKAQNVLDNQHQGRSRGLNRLPSGERRDKTARMRDRLKTRRDDLFGERNRREDESRAEFKKKYGL
jgi:hypothetical protein